MPKSDKKAKKDGSISKESVDDEYYGMVNVEKWPEDLKEVLHKQMTERLNKKLP